MNFQQAVSYVRSQTLLSNSFYLMLSNLVVSGVGFIYWILVIKLYGAEASGTIQTMLAALNIVNLLSLLGMNNSIVKFLPKAARPAELVQAMLGIITIVSVVLGVLVFWIVGGIDDQLAFVRSFSWLLFLCFFSGISALNAITDSLFIYYRKAHFILGINSLMSVVRLVLVFGMVAWGAVGILVSVTASIFLAFILSIFCLVYFIKLPIRLSFNFMPLRDIRTFAAASYFSGLIASLPSHMIPIFITKILGPEMTAIYYFPATIIAFLATIPQSTATSLYTEISHEPSLTSQYLKKSLYWSYGLLLPAVLLVMYLLPVVLGFIGKDFADQGIGYLRLAGLALLISSVSYLANSLYYGGGNTRRVLIVSSISAVCVLSGSYFGLRYGGLLGLGIGHVVAQSIITLVNMKYVHEKLYS